MRRLVFLLTAAVGLAAVGCGSDGKAISPTAPKFEQPEVKHVGKPAGRE